MPRRQKVSVEYSNFTRGLITEASPLTFPENASLDEENVNINRDGSRQRRFGMTWATTAHNITDATAISTSGEATNSFTWKSAGNDGNVNIGVLQKGRDLHFFDIDDIDPASAFVATSSFSVGEVPSPNHQAPFSFASAYGKLLVAVGTKTIYVFTWTGSGVTRTSYDIKIRDLFGIYDSAPVDSHPTGATLDNYRWYNLRNQGWPASTRLANNAGAGGQPLAAATEGDPIQRTYNDLGFWPSNADLIWACKMGSIGSSGWIDSLEAFDANEITKQYFGSTPAPKGHYVIDLFQRGASRGSVSGFGGLPADETYGGITGVSSYAGRIWYSVTETGSSGTDKNSPNLGNMVFYSKATEDEANWGNCHSENDQTSEDFNQVLASDGGFINIPEAGTIFGMVALGESHFIIASNGVWEVYGGDTGFSAEVQSVVKVTDVGALSTEAITKGDNLIGYWAESGIMAISLEQGTLRGVANNITESTIQTFYDDIPVSRKKLARGSYDYLSKQATWMYSDTNLGSDYYYNREIVFDLATGSFTKRYIPGLTSATKTGPYPTAYLRLRNLLAVSTEVPVTVGGALVTAGGLPVTIGEASAEQATQNSTMYWTAYDDATNENFRLGGYLNFEFEDWQYVQNDDGTYGHDQEAYILTGALTGGDSSKIKWMPYVSVRMKRTESAWNLDANYNLTMVGESGCKMHAQWQWTNDSMSNRWSRPQQVYRLPRAQFYNGNSAFYFDVVTTRNKLRGNGNAVSLKFVSEPKKDMYIYGWGMEVVQKAESASN